MRTTRVGPAFLVWPLQTRNAVVDGAGKLLTLLFSISNGTPFSRVRRRVVRGHVLDLFTMKRRVLRCTRPWRIWPGWSHRHGRAGTYGTDYAGWRWMWWPCGGGGLPPLRLELLPCKLAFSPSTPLVGRRAAPRLERRMTRFLVFSSFCTLDYFTGARPVC